MRYRWDPAYPMGRRDMPAPDATLRAGKSAGNGPVGKAFFSTFIP